MHGYTVFTPPPHHHHHHHHHHHARSDGGHPAHPRLAPRARPAARLRPCSSSRAARSGQRRLAPLLRLRLAHNLLLVAYSFLVGWATISKLKERSGLYATVCVAGAGDAPYWYASKLWEWFDTVLIYARGRKPAALHLGHHATAASVVALNLLGRARPTPLFDVGTALNATVHTYMYLYYADPLVFRPFRRYITIAQIAQHAIIVACLVGALATPGCDAPLAPYVASLAAYAFYLVTFLGFYLKTYRKTPVASHHKLV